MSLLPSDIYVPALNIYVPATKEQSYKILFVKDFIRFKNLEKLIQATSTLNINKRIYEPLPDLEPDPTMEMPKVEIYYPKIVYKPKK
jgi:hypothetical protein